MTPVYRYSIRTGVQPTVLYEYWCTGHLGHLGIGTNLTKQAKPVTCSSRVHIVISTFTFQHIYFSKRRKRKLAVVVVLLLCCVCRCLWEIFEFAAKYGRTHTVDPFFVDRGFRGRLRPDRDETLVADNFIIINPRPTHPSPPANTYLLYHTVPFWHLCITYIRTRTTD